MVRNIFAVLAAVVLAAPLTAGVAAAQTTEQDDTVFDRGGVRVEDTGGDVPNIQVDEDVVRSDIEETLVPQPETRGRIADNVTIEIGAGANGYTHDLGDQLEAGFTGNVRGGFNNDNVIGLEAGLISLINAPDEDINNDPDIADYAMGSMAEIALRANWINRSIARPFVSGGVGFANVSTIGEEELEIGRQVYDDTSTMHIPVSLGVQVYPVENFTFSGRADYRFLTNVADNDLPSGNTWSFSVNLGTTF